MDKETAIDKLSELMNELIQAKRPDAAVIMSYVICAVHEDMCDQFAHLSYRAINALVDKRTEGQLMLAQQVNEALAHIEWDR